MKKHILLFTFITIGLLLLTGRNAYSQFERIKVDYTVEEVVNGNEVSYNINVKAQDLTGKVTYTLYRDEPLLENIVSKSDETFDSSYQFKNLSPGKYFLIVFESVDKEGLETIIIRNDKSSQQ